MQELQEVFEERECGVLACRTCDDFVVSAKELVERMQRDRGVGTLGVLSSHRTSSKHTAAVEKASETPKKGPMDTYFKRAAPPPQQQPGSSGPPRQQGREHDAAAAAAAAAAAPAAAATGAEGNGRIEEVALHGLADGLCHPDQHALVLHLSKKLLSCKGIGRPKASGGKPDLALHVPLSAFYEEGTFHRTKKQFLGGTVELRQGAFHSKGCMGLAEPDEQRCKQCLRLTNEKYLEHHLPHLGKKWKDMHPTLNDAHFSFAQMVEKKDHFSQMLELARLQTLTATRKVHAKEQAVREYQRILVLLSDNNSNNRLLVNALIHA